jgi:hypothetical protein
MWARCVFLTKSFPAFRPEMAGLSDSLTIGILLILVFGAVSFYLYSRMGQNEKRLGLLENLLLTLKMSTEASLSGPDMVEATSGPTPLRADEVDQVNEEDYADMLKEVPSAASGPFGSSATSASVAPVSAGGANEEAEAEELLRSMNVEKVTVNYESMRVKELRGLATERGLPASLTTKKELVDALKRSPASAAPTPLTAAADDLEGSEKLEGFAVNLQE